MKYLGEVILPAAMGVVLCVIIFFMKGALSFVIGLPIWMLGIAIVIAGLSNFIQINLLTSFFRYGKEGFIFMEARKTGKLVIIDTEIGTNNSEFLLGEKEDPKSPTFSDETSGLKIDASLVSKYAEPQHFPLGLNILGYAHHSPLPQTTRNHLGFKAIVDGYFREGEKTPDRKDSDGNLVIHPAKKLAFLTDKEKIELIMKSEQLLAEDTKTKVGKYLKKRVDEKTKETIHYVVFQKDGKWWETKADMDDLVHAVQEMKADIIKLPIHEGYYSMNEAFKFNNIPYTAQHLAGLKNMFQRLSYLDMIKKFNAWTYGLIGMGILAVFFGGVFVLIKFTGKG
jgi:hypothetical protein